MSRTRSSSQTRRRRMLLHRTAHPDVGEQGGLDEIDVATGSTEETIELDCATVSFTPAPEPLPLRVNDANQPWRSAVRRLVEGMRPLTWVFTGDGTTQAAEHTNGGRGYVELFDNRIRGGLRRLLDVIVNTGLEGGRVATLRRTRDWRIDRFRPDVVSILFGTTDALAGPGGREAFREELRRLVTELLDAGVIVVLHTPHRPLRRAARSLGDLPAYARVVRSLADELGVPLVDHWKHWRDGRIVPLLAADGLHANAAGQRELVRLLLHELGIDETSVDRNPFDRQNTRIETPDCGART